MNHQILQELKTTLDAWLIEIDLCDFVDDGEGCPLRRLLIEKRQTIIKALEKQNQDENTKKD